MKHERTVEGSGKSPKEAEKNLHEATQKLSSKLEKAGADQYYSAVSRNYSADFQLPPDFKLRGTVASRLSVKSTEGWDEIAGKFRKAANGNEKKYTGTYSVSVIVDLTAEQHKALEEPPRATIDEHLTSSIDRLF